MARKKQTGTEIKLYQIDTMVYLGTKNIITKLSMFAEFLKNGGVDFADKQHINRARALERFDKDYKISDIKELTTDGQANETWLRKNGLLYSVGGRYELSPIANAILKEKITLADYCFLLLSKQWIKIKELGGKDEYKANLLSVILADLIERKSIPVSEFVSHIGQIALDKYSDEYDGLELSNKEAARYLIEPLLISKLIEEKDGKYILNSTLHDLAVNYVNNSNRIKRIDQVECDNEEYWNGFQYGIYDIIDDKNKHLYMSEYPHLFAMKELYEDNRSHPLQQIFYGAPGTGKSHRITGDDGVKKADENNLVFRTTFHPDSDYSTFVGCYKPTMDEDGGSGEEKIVYRFNPQVFTDAYIAAWRTDEDVYLIIEEINRGNCAQIFGDLFQLLDRDGEGYSKYEIKPDVDLTKYIAGCKLDISGVNNSNGNDISKKIASGEVLKLPKNLYIWATMNTSDQSLFPIDSAFKRRWEWEYIPIDYNCPESNYTIIVDDEHKYSWPEFLKKVNELIYDTTKSEDKQMGNFFLSNVKGKEIGCDQFVSKVMFYLWNDICKDNPKAKKSIYSCKLEESEEGKEDIREFKFSDLFPAGDERNKLLIGFMTYLERKNIADNKDKE